MANNERVQISLDFKANTQQAQQAMNQLQTNLSKIAMEGSSIRVDSASLNQASEAAKKLSIHLNNAYNSSTGKLDLSKFHKSLKQGQDSVKSLSVELLKAGSTGQQAFVQLSQSVAQAERPVITIGNRLARLGETLKNTVRWQISTSILQGFTGAVQKAYNYTKDLNKNLNDIRIVTGYNADKMASFAKEANNVAKALSSTTNEYAKASLIYFQQGLNDQEVKERTEVTMKMASITRQAAEEVSDQLTAIWNNFDNGSKSIEYYADVITALGAATASSSEEISEGLNKFAAVAETVGLSYEYAASALATVTATTRQSADIVGTAFKTLFARIQDLELGNTLDDGTTLGQYSEALAKVGINIKDSSGQMKDMNNILDEMGSKWNTLSKDTQVAVAQSVAGVRQYTQLIALMDNWDFFQQNLSTATGAEGTLNKQFAIYEESWEAASKRMQASAEALYDKLLDDEFFIKLTDGLGSFLDSIGAIIDGLGGMKGVLLSVGGILTQMFAGKIQQGVQNLAHSFSIMMGGAAKAHSEITQQMTDANVAVMADPTLNAQSKQQITSANQLMSMKEKMGVLGESLSKNERTRYEQEISIMEIHQQENLALQQKLETERALVEEIKKELALLREAPIEETELGGDGEARRASAAKVVNRVRDKHGLGSNEYKQAKTNLDHFTHLDNTRTDFTSSLMGSYYDAGDEQKDFKYDFLAAGRANNVSSITQNFGKTKKGPQYTGAFAFMGGSEGTEDGPPLPTDKMNAAKAALQGLRADMEAITSGTAVKLDEAIEQALDAKSGKELRKKLEAVRKQLTQTTIEGQKVESTLKKLGQGKHITQTTKKVKQLNQAETTLNKTTKELEENTKKINDAVKNFNPKHVMTGTEAFLKLSGAASGATMGMQQLINLIDVWNNQDLSMGEKITSTIMALSMGIPMIMQAVGSLNQVTNGLQAAAVARKLLTEATQNDNIVQAASVVLSKKAGDESQKQAMAELQEKLVKSGLATETNKEVVAETLLKNAKFKSKAASLAKTNGASAEILASNGVTAATNTQTGAVNTNTSAWFGNPITAVIAVALLAVVAAVSLVSSAMEANSEAIQENSKKATEKVEKTREEVKANGDLVDSYLTLYNTYKTTGEGKEELYNTSKDLVDVYNIEGGAIAALAGDYNALTKSIVNARRAELSNQKQKERTAQIAQAAALIDKGTDDNGNTLTEGRFKGEFNNDVWGSQFGVGEDEFGIDTIIKNGNYKYLKINGGDISFDIDKNNVNEVYGFYNELHRFAQEMQARGISSGSDIYNDVIEEIESTEEQFLALQQSVQTEREFTKEESMLNTTFGNGKGISDIQNIHDYNKFADAYRKNYERILTQQGVVAESEEWNTEMKSIESFLTSNSITAKYAEIEKGLSELKVSDAIKEQLKDLSEEDLQTLWTITIDDSMTIEEIHEAIDIAQKEAEKFNIYLTPKIKTKGLSLFEQGDWEALEQFFNDNVKILGSYDSFLQKVGGSLDKAREFFSVNKVANDALYLASVYSIQKTETSLINAKAARDAYNKYDRGLIDKTQLLKTLSDNQYLKDVEKVLEEKEKEQKLQQQQDDLRVGSKDYKDIRTTEKNYFDFAGRDDNAKAYFIAQDLDNYTSTNSQNIEGAYTFGVGLTMKQTDQTAQLINEKLTELRGNNNVYEENDLEKEITKLLSQNTFYTNFATGMEAQKAAAIDVILSSAGSSLDESMTTALEKYRGALNRKEGDYSSYIADLDALTNGKFSEYVLNKEYKITEGIELAIDNAYNEDGTTKAKEWNVSTSISNEALEALMESEDGFINRLMNVLQYGTEFNELETEINTQHGIFTALEDKIKETFVSQAEKDLKTYYQYNFELMLQREQQIEQQGLEIELWKDLTAEVLATNSALNAYGAGKVAEQLMLQAKYLDELVSQWDDLTGVINSATVSALEQKEALATLTTTMEKMLGLSSGDLSQVWIENNLDNIEFALTNSGVGAQQKARKIMAEGILEGGGFQDSTEIEHIIKELENANKGDTLESTDSIINNLLRGDGSKGGSLSASAQTALLGLFGYSTQVVQREASSITDNGDGTYTIVDATGKNERVVNAADVQTIEEKDENGNVTSTKYQYYMVDSQRTIKTGEEYDFYDLQYDLSNIDSKNNFESQTISLNNQLKETERRLTRINDQADNLYGADRIKKLEEYGETLKESLAPDGLYDQLIKQAKKETINKYDMLKQVGLELGVAETLFNFQDKDAIVEHYQNYINSLIKEGKTVDAELLTNQLNSYLEAYETGQEYVDEKAEKFREWQENNLAIITGSLEYNIGNLNDSLTLIERKLERIQDDAYKAAEAFDLIFGTNFDGNSQNNENSKIGLIEDKLVEYETTIESYEKAYANNEISAEQFATKMKEMRDSIYESVDALYEEDEQMKEFYGTTLSNAQEEIEKYTNLIEHQNTVLDHYANLSKLIGKEVDYEWMGEILSGQTVVLEQLAKESQVAYNNLLDDVASFEQQYNNAVTQGLNQEVIDRLKNQWLEAQQAAAEKQDKMLQDLAAWAEAEQALLENSLNQFRKEFEKALTGGLGFDVLSSSMDRTQSLQEEYLTTTNKIYETNKLISNVQKEIDKTTNSVAKKKLADFQKQTEALGKQTQLSQFELNIQQAKYDLLLAEIALEEAQNAKSQVRLRRDSEGNFGYVYTADQQKITDAEQEFMDAENKLYNIRLEGANNYISKQAELNQQHFDDMKQLEIDFQSGVIASEEEFLERRKALTEYYTEQSKQYSYLETIAIVDDQRIQKEAWTNSYKDIIFSANQFSEDIDKYMGQVDGAFTRWQGVVDQVETTTGADLESLRDKVGEITTKSTELSKALLGDKLDGTGGVAGALETVMDNCINAVNYYTTTLFPKLEELAKHYDDIANSANDAALAVGKVATEQSGSEWQNTIRQALEYFDAGEMDNLRTLYEKTLNYTNKLSWEDFLKYDTEKQRKFLQHGTNLEPQEDSLKEDPKTRLFFSVKPNATVYSGQRLREERRSPSTAAIGSYNDTARLQYTNVDTIIRSDINETYVSIGNDKYVNKADIERISPQLFDTGGYTGSWGPEGKWAMLHQKEIVLNAQDTENLLTAMDILRQIVSVIDIQSQYNQLANTLIPSVSSYNNNGIEQNVHIEASFPSVTDHNEIELALRNIVNEASQYINRK